MTLENKLIVFLEKVFSRVQKNVHDTTNVHVVVKNKNEKCNVNFFISYINMLKHKKRKVETIPRKYKWRRICKDGKKKKSRYRN